MPMRVFLLLLPHLLMLPVRMQKLREWRHRMNVSGYIPYLKGRCLQTNHNKEYFNYIKDKCTVIPNPIDLKENSGIALKTKKKNEERISILRT